MRPLHAIEGSLTAYAALSAFDAAQMPTGRHWPADSVVGRLVDLIGRD